MDKVNIFTLFYFIYTRLQLHSCILHTLLKYYYVSMKFCAFMLYLLSVTVPVLNNMARVMFRFPVSDPSPPRHAIGLFPYCSQCFLVVTLCIFVLCVSLLLRLIDCYRVLLKPCFSLISLTFLSLVSRFVPSLC